MLNIKTVTVIGANGTMGCNVSGIFASFGGARVFMVARDKAAAQAAAQRAALSVKADAVAENLVPVSFDKLEECAAQSDLIFESVAENLEVKKSVYEKLGSVRAGTIVATGTSGLSIETMRGFLPESVKNTYFGVHMFNPPYSMTLCELTPCAGADETLTAEIKAYLSDVLLRSVVITKDSPAFIGNRIGFYFINLALQYAEKYRDQGGIDYIDAILGQFTGRNMPPIATADFVGLDVYRAIVANLSENTADYQHDCFNIPDYVSSLISKNLLGRKTGCGLYKTVVEGEKKIRLVYDIASGEYREKEKYSFPFANKMVSALRVGDYLKAIGVLESNNSQEAKICLEMLLRYIVYGVFVANEVGSGIADADAVMANGFNWIPPLSLVEALGGGERVVELIECGHMGTVPQIDYRALLLQERKAQFDYRRFLKAKI